MQTTDPELAAPKLRVAEHQPEYTPVTVALVRDKAFPAAMYKSTAFNAVVMAFRPSEIERQQIAAGADVYVSLLTFGRPQQGIVVTAGKEAMAGYYGVEPTAAVEEPNRNGNATAP